jgi:hypothetical protein
MTCLIKPQGTDLVSRSTEAALRQSIERAVTKDGLAKLDLSDVVFVAESFADETFGVLTLIKVVDWVVESIELHGATDNVLNTIARVIDRRCPVQAA